MPPLEPGSPVRRRAVLAAGLVTATAGLVTGCDLPDLLGAEESGEPTAADLAALRSVASESAQLAGRYDNAIATAGDQAAVFTAIRDAHREHHAALGRLVATSVAPPVAASPSASGSGSATEDSAVKDLAATERAAADRASKACIEVAARFAPLVGTIAAARAGHAEALS